MSKTLLAAAILAAFTAAVHLFVGTPEIAAPLFRSSLAPEIVLILYGCWHFVSFALAISAVGLFLGARPAHRESRASMVRFISWLWLSFGAVVLVVGVFGYGGRFFLALPQWVLLVPVGVLGLWGSAPAKPEHDVALTRGN